MSFALTGREVSFFFAGFVACIVFRWVLVAAESGVLTRPIEKLIRRRRQGQQ